MDLTEIWLWYCAERPGTDLTIGERPTPAEVLEDLFEFVPLFAARDGAIRGVRYDPAFDEEADGALLGLAMTDDLAAWDDLSAGAWRVLRERLAHAMTVVAINEVAGDPVMGLIPGGLDARTRGRAHLLRLLLGGARTIPPEWLDRSGGAAWSGQDARGPVRRQ